MLDLNYKFMLLNTAYYDNDDHVELGEMRARLWYGMLWSQTTTLVADEVNAIQ